MTPVSQRGDTHPHFESLSLIDCPPVGTRNFNFSRGINFIDGENGSGKTSIAQALRTGMCTFGGRALVIPSTVSALLDKYWELSYVDQSFSHYIGDVGATDHWAHHCIGRPALQQRMGVLLSQMVSDKLGVQVTKFHSVPYVGEETFAVEIFPNGWVEVHAGSALKAVEHYSPYGSIEELFHAGGERFLVAFAGLMAAREELQLKGPIIFDGVIGGLAEFRASVMREIRKFPCQVIILDAPADIKALWKLDPLRPTDELP